MIDLKYLQKNFDEASAKFMKKGVDSETLENLKELFRILKEKNAILEVAKAEQNKMSKLFGEYMREKKDVSELKVKVDAKKEEIVGLQETARVAQQALESVALAMPNLPNDSVPEGANEEDNVELRKVLDPRSFDFTPKEHWALAEVNGWIEFDRGVKLA
jgi:seryl-tRNA synthetase